MVGTMGGRCIRELIRGLIEEYLVLYNGGRERPTTYHLLTRLGFK
jgi:hypothetical protein